MVPSQQGFVAGKHLGLDSDEGLIIEAELALLQRDSHIVLERTFLLQ
jgi:hypothetical protein